MKEVAAELDCDWHTVNDAVTTYGEALFVADRRRLNKTTAIGLDETSFVKLSDRLHKDYATTVADVENHQIIDILPTRRYLDVARFIDKQESARKERIRFGALDMSPTYAAVYSVVLPGARQVVDSFHVIKLANDCLDQVRRRVQSEQLGHRGRRDDPLYRARRALVTGEEKLGAEARERLWSLLSLGDPGAEVAIAHRVTGAPEGLLPGKCRRGARDARGARRALLERCHATRGEKARADPSPRRDRTTRRRKGLTSGRGPVNRLRLPQL